MSPPHTRTTAAATGGNSIPAPRRKGYTHLNVQFGRGSHAPTFAPHARHGLVCRSFRFTDAAGIAEEMAGAALIISHAGSGSIIESLSRQKPLLVVVNDALMDNHQAELAGQLDADGHLHCTGCEGLLAALQQRTPQCPPPPPQHTLPSHSPTQKHTGTGLPRPAQCFLPAHTPTLCNRCPILLVRNAMTPLGRSWALPRLVFATPVRWRLSGTAPVRAGDFGALLPMPPPKAREFAHEVDALMGW